MNKTRRAEIDKANALLSEALEIIQRVAEEEREAFDNLSEGLQQSERGQAIEAAADALDTAQSSLEDAINSAFRSAKRLNPSARGVYGRLSRSG